MPKKKKKKKRHNHDGEYHSFEKWRTLGFSVLKGEKHRLRDLDGVPMFYRDQVSRTPKRTYYLDVDCGFDGDPWDFYD